MLNWRETQRRGQRGWRMQKDGNERGRERKEVKGNDVEVIEKEETARGRKGGDGRK